MRIYLGHRRTQHNSIAFSKWDPIGDVERVDEIGAVINANSGWLFE